MRWSNSEGSMSRLMVLLMASISIKSPFWTTAIGPPLAASGVCDPHQIHDCRPKNVRRLLRPRLLSDHAQRQHWLAIAFSACRDHRQAFVAYNDDIAFNHISAKNAYKCGFFTFVHFSGAFKVLALLAVILPTAPSGARLPRKS